MLLKNCILEYILASGVLCYLVFSLSVFPFHTGAKKYLLNRWAFIKQQQRKPSFEMQQINKQFARQYDSRYLTLCCTRTGRLRHRGKPVKVKNKIYYEVRSKQDISNFKWEYIQVKDYHPSTLKVTWNIKFWLYDFYVPQMHLTWSTELTASQRGWSGFPAINRWGKHLQNKKMCISWLWTPVFSYEAGPQT